MNLFLGILGSALVMASLLHPALTRDYVMGPFICGAGVLMLIVGILRESA